jgi:hypothetical protein
MTRRPRQLVRGDLQQIAGQCGRSLSGLHLVRPAGGQKLLQQVVGISLHRAGDVHFTLGRPLPDPFHERRGAAVHLSECATATP